MTGLLRVRPGPWLRTQGCAVGQFAGEAQHLRPQCGDQHRRRLHTGWHALNRHITSHRVMMPEPSGRGADLGMSALPYGLAVSP